MSEPVLLVEKTGEIATVTLNRPSAMNALSRELRGAIAAAVDELEADPAIRVMILTGAGKAFCAGLDLKELGQKGLSNPNDTITLGDPVRSLGKFSGPIIGAINGVAITGGFELALACDVLVASPNARFADTHARVGVMPGWGLSQKLSRAIGIYRAKELSLTGNFLSAPQAAEWGLINRVVAREEDLLPTCRQLAQDMLSVIPEMLVSYKGVIDEGFAQSFGDGMQTEQRRARAANVAVSPEEVEKRRAAIQARGKSQV
ncbi:enoyl-CoA hydratase [Emcibacter sp. SYSU 3D8]|uniref:enoyl-CoA hydratase n=1 Tax=Emcibacter sp. SYSU 3D8 TaxID=3133969 RepID=UPI0031FF0125